MEEKNELIESQEIPGEGAESKPLVKKFNDFVPKPSFKEALVPAVVILAIILAGGLTGYLLANRGALGASPAMITPLIGGAQLIEGSREIGIEDVETFRDTAEGRIEVNDNSEALEGSHKLIRPGGPSQVAYVTSSVVDLNQFIGKCVQVWGETFAAQQAGWLMDIGRVKILNSCPKGL